MEIEDIAQKRGKEMVKEEVDLERKNEEIKKLEGA